MNMEQTNLQWKQSYELGIEDIDFQHHYFFNLILRIASDLAESSDRLYKNSLIIELSAYARFHFISEENLMFREGYPELEEHKMLHLELLDKLSVKGNQFLMVESGDASKNIIDFLLDWFFQHTTGVDKAFALYYHGQHPL